MRCLIGIAALPAIAPVATAAIETAPAIVPATAAEVAYWTKLQQEIAALRAANSSGGRAIIQRSKQEIDGIMARLEGFVDAREDDPVDDLSEDITAYREQLITLVIEASTHLQKLVKFHELRATNPMLAMTEGASYHNELELLERLKPSLATLHGRINQAVIAAGGGRSLFFQTLNIGDRGVDASATAVASPAERDERFLAEVANLLPGLEVMVRARLIKARLDGRSGTELDLRRDELLKHLAMAEEKFAQHPSEELQRAVNETQDTAEDWLLTKALVQLELLRRDNATAHAVTLTEWNAAYARWRGVADTLQAPVVCERVAISPSHAFVAYAREESVLRVATLPGDGQAGEPPVDIPVDGKIRGLAFGPKNELMVFTTTGQHLIWPPFTSEAEIGTIIPARSEGVLGTLAADVERTRFVWAWGGTPIVYELGAYTQFKPLSSSRITSLALNPAGTRLVIGYGGDDLDGKGDRFSGFDVYRLTGDKWDSKLGDAVRYGTGLTGSAAVAAAIDTTGDHVAIVASSDIGTTIHLHHLGDKVDMTLITFDRNPYHHLAFAELDGVRHLVATARDGVVRIWNEAGELVRRFEVPVGSAGVGAAVMGTELLSVSIGGDGLYRWNLADGSLVQTLAGTTPSSDAAALQQRFAQEQSWQPVLAAMRSIDLSNDSAEQYLEIATKHPEATAGLGLQALFNSQASALWSRQMRALRDEKKFLEAYQLGKHALASGVASDGIYYQLVRAAFSAKQADAMSILEEAIALYPADRALRMDYHRYRKLQFIDQNNVDAAMREVNEMVDLSPNDPDNYKDYLDVLMNIAANVYDTDMGRSLELYIKALDYARTPDEQVQLLEGIFSWAYHLKNYRLAGNAAAKLIELKPEKKNDRGFMDAARYAVSQSQ